MERSRHAEVLDDVEEEIVQAEDWGMFVAAYLVYAFNLSKTKGVDTRSEYLGRYSRTIGMFRTHSQKGSAQTHM